jgi:HK97 family phage portal protein
MLLTASRKPQEEKAQSFEDTIALLDSAGKSTNSGVYVNSDTAMRQSTVFACVRVLSEIIGQLPIEVQTKKGGQWVESESHDIIRLLREPNDWQTQHDLISTLISWSELAGNSYLYKIRSGDGVVRKLIPVESRHCDVQILKDLTLDYMITSQYGVQGTYKRDRIFHLRNFGTQGYMGLSTIACHREGIGLALQLETHATSAYKNGLQSNKWVKMGRPIQDPILLDQFKGELRKYQGATANGEMPVLYDADINEFKGVSAVDAQYIESRKMQKEEIATMFLVPVFLLNSTQNTTWGSGLEQISRSFVRFSLNPRLNRLSQTLVRELVPENARHKTRIVFDTDEFTLGDFKDRMDGYRSAIESGVLNPNECRDIEKRNPRENGDKYKQPINIGTEGEENELQNPEPPVTD